MSVLDELKKLDEQRAKLIADAKKEALGRANDAIAQLNALGFRYSLTEVTVAKKGTVRTSGLKLKVLDIIKQKPDGANRANIVQALVATGQTAAEQSVSNALANLKKQGHITLTDGLYRPAA